MKIYVLFAILLSGFVFANVEKTVFVAPPRQTVRDASIDNLLLVSLNPRYTTARTRLNATFPSIEAPKGTDTWMLLEGLFPEMRYEVRVCWLATQPTAFKLSTHTMVETFEDPALLSSLTIFSNNRRDEVTQPLIQQLQDRKYESPLSHEVTNLSLLFLQISAAADYYSLNRTLMEHVPRVFADIILDRYILNIFPKSLVPTAGYIVVLAIGSWFLSSFVWRTLSDMVQAPDLPVKATKKDR